MEGIKVTWRHSPREVREEMSRRTKVDKWKGDDRWWQEFLVRSSHLSSHAELISLIGCTRKVLEKQRHANFSRRICSAGNRVRRVGEGVKFLVGWRLGLQ